MNTSSTPLHSRSVRSQKQFDNLLAAAHGACLLLQKADNMAFDESRGVEIIAEHKNLTDIVTEVGVCGRAVNTCNIQRNVMTICS